VTSPPSAPQLAAPTARPPFGSITDVPGVEVGHHQRTGRGWQTGTTVVFARQGATPGVSVRGGGPGTRETDALHPEHLVERIHAICLTGGSAFGLSAADGVVAWLEERRLGFPIGDPLDPIGVVPVVPAAVIFDLGRAGRFDHRPDATFGRRAIGSTRADQRRWGSVGAGTGAKAGGLQGGVGTAGTVVTIPGAMIGAECGDVEVTVGALAVVNANGSPIDRATGLPWTTPGPGLRRPSSADRSRLRAVLDGQQQVDLNTTIGVVATSARLSKAEVGKLCGVAHDGLARAIRPAHSMTDGDTVFGLATGDVGIGDGPAAMRSTTSRPRAFNLLLAAAADTFASACTHAIISATSTAYAPAYLELCPSVRSSPGTRRGTS
jgi:L-aminopeptidase/D-esterase-like protein